MVCRQTPEELLGVNKFEVDEERAHIILDQSICSKCAEKGCLVICPAVLYKLADGAIQFDCAGCLECGACRMVCKAKGIISWQYPRGSFGVTFRQG